MKSTVGFDFGIKSIVWFKVNSCMKMYIIFKIPFLEDMLELKQLFIPPTFSEYKF